MLAIYWEQSGKSHFRVIFQSGNGEVKVGNPTFEFLDGGVRRRCELGTPWVGGWAVSGFYWYFCGNYHFFDLFGKWYGKKKSGMVFYF